MMLILSLLCLVFSKVSALQCSLHFYPSLVCHHYNYDGGCTPGLEHLCDPVKITYQNPRCPTYICLEPKTSLPTALPSTSTTAATSSTRLSSSSTTSTTSSATSTSGSSTTGSTSRSSSSSTSSPTSSTTTSTSPSSTTSSSTRSTESSPEISQAIRKVRHDGSHSRTDIDLASTPSFGPSVETESTALLSSTTAETPETTTTSFLYTTSRRTEGSEEEAEVAATTSSTTIPLLLELNSEESVTTSTTATTTQSVVVTSSSSEASSETTTTATTTPIVVVTEEVTVGSPSFGVETAATATTTTLLSTSFQETENQSRTTAATTTTPFTSLLEETETSSEIPSTTGSTVVLNKSDSSFNEAPEQLNLKEATVQPESEVLNLTEPLIIWNETNSAPAIEAQTFNLTEVFISNQTNSPTGIEAQQLNLTEALISTETNSAPGIETRTFNLTEIFISNETNSPTGIEAQPFNWTEAVISNDSDSLAAIEMGPVQEKLSRILKSPYGDYICADGRDCTVTFEFAPQCTIYVQDDDHPDCQVPCKTELCKEELHYNLPNCPIYFCTFGSSSSTTTTPAPKPGPPSPISPAGYGSSVAINVVFGALFISLILKKIFKRREPFRPIIRSQGVPTSFANPTFRAGQEPNENDPLLARLGFRRGAPPPTNDFGLQNFDAAESRLVSFDDPATFEPSAPPPPYTSCAPSVTSAPSAAESTIEIDLDPLDHPLDQAIGFPARTEPRSLSAFDRWFRKKKYTVPLEDIITDDDL